MRIAVAYLGRHGPLGPISLEMTAHLSKHAEVFGVISTQADNFHSWKKLNIPLVEAPTFESTVAAFASCLNQPRIARVAARIRALSPDVILYSIVHPWTPFLQRYLRPIPHVITVHDPIPHPGVIHRMSSFWETVCARRAQRCVVLSARFNSVMAAKGVDSRKIDVIPLAVPSFYGQADAPADAPLNTLLFFGRITAYKGLEILLGAFRILCERRPGVTLKIVGEGSLAPYTSLLEGLPRTDIVNRWAPDDEVASFFKPGTLVVLPYTSASQSAVVPVAAAFGLPVIATNVGALPDQVEHGRTGLLRLVMGSVAEAVVRRARCPVLTVKHPTTVTFDAP